ncbi:MAG: L,D-transpeptidase [Actinomycetota bacterium]|nr:L,D-transpeptidase [Actinomycetota bacterium]
MDRRHFLFGASALGLTACSHPEHNLLDEYADSSIPLQPGSPRLSTSTTNAAPQDETPTTASVNAQTTDNLPFNIDEEDRPGLSFVAEATVSTVNVYPTDLLTEPAFEFKNPISSGGPLVFLVENLNDLQTLEVLLPTRPNGSFGWINGNQVRLTRHNYAIKVWLNDFVLAITHREQTIFETTVGVARENAPTPLGRYYTTELLRPPSPNSGYGSYAYGLSGFSDTFDTFAGGPGQLGIHGTNDPTTLGTNVSSGCVRLHNDDITYLAESIQLPLGVPVDII